MTQIVLLSTSLVNLGELQIGHNGISQLSPPLDPGALPSLHTLNLGNNVLCSWIEIQEALQYLPRSVILSDLWRCN